MKDRFEKPVCKVIHFANDVISTSACGCDIGGVDVGGCNENLCTSINTYCDCQANRTDPNAANCIKD